MAAAAISVHLEQITASAKSIDELEFAGPQAFTNALLSRPDITNLIRDVEVHEKSLFSLASSDAHTRRQTSMTSRQPVSNHFAARTPRKTTAVAAVLGRDLHRRVTHAKDVSNVRDVATNSRSGVPPMREELDVDVLLEGAKRLCAVYPSVNVSERIAKLSERHQQLSASITYYEDRVQRNSEQLESMHQRRGRMDEDEEDDDDHGDGTSDVQTPVRPTMTADDIAHEEDDIRELEERKKMLEERVSGMEKDLGSLRR